VKPIGSSEKTAHVFAQKAKVAAVEVLREGIVIGCASKCSAKKARQVQIALKLIHGVVHDR